MLTGCGGNPVATTSLPQQENSLLSSTPTPTPSLVSKPVKGFICGYNTITDGGETISNISVLEIPAYIPDSSGNLPLVSQFSDYLKEEYPQDWNTPEIQELNSKLNASLSQYKPLSEYDSSAKVYSIYQDSETDTPMSVTSEGQFEGNVLTNEQDSSVKLEVTLGEDEIAETETIASSSDTLASSATSGVVLKSCPEKIIALPDDIVILKIFSDHSIDLKKAGLKLSLNNKSIGCISPIVYLCIFGERKHSVAYSALYIKKNLDTPIDTVITATTSTGLSLNIPLEVVKRCAGISGRVYTGEKPLIKGYVKSIGPKSHCKLDSEGRYNLPAVFLGHERAVIATWWTQGDNGKKIKHREEKIIDFFNSGVTDFDFGVPPTPTPTLTPSVTPTPRPPYDEFYNKKVSTVLYQYNQWETELGKKEAIERIIKWLNGQVSDGPPIPDEIAGATSIGNPYDIWVEFRDGMSICISTSDPIVIEEQDANEPLPRKEEIKPLINLTAASSNNTTVKNADVIMLSPYYWEIISGGYRVENLIEGYLTANNYNVKCIMTRMNESQHGDEPIQNDIYFDWNNPIKDNPNFLNPERPLINCYKAPDGNWDNIVSPWEIETIGKYGIIYINAHGGPINVDEDAFNPDYPGTTSFRMSCTVDVLDRDGTLNTKLERWTNKHSSEMGCTKWWFYRYRKINDVTHKAWAREIALTNKYFTSLNADSTTNFKGSLIYWCGCCAWHMRDSFNSAKAYIGYDRFSNSKWAFPFAYDFFWFMMYGAKDCPKKFGHLVIPYAPVPEGTPSFDENKPMDATEALNVLTTYYKVNPDPNPYTDLSTTDGSGFGCTAKIWQKDENEHIYFPVPVTVTVEKKGD
jgi:hypothetical protein